MSKALFILTSEKESIIADERESCIDIVENCLKYRDWTNADPETISYIIKDCIEQLKNK
jgi:hypothetical protein